MEWKRSVQETYSKQWSAEIAMRDAKGMHESKDVYTYLENKLDKVLATQKKPGQAGWTFIMGKAAHHKVHHCLCWADGSKGGQASPLGSSPSGGERWWPCIVVLGLELIPFYCPALAWSESRAWEVHASRLRTFTVGNEPMPIWPRPWDAPTYYYDYVYDYHFEDRSPRPWDAPTYDAETDDDDDFVIVN